METETSSKRLIKYTSLVMVLRRYSHPWSPLVTVNKPPYLLHTSAVWILFWFSILNTFVKMKVLTTAGKMFSQKLVNKHVLAKPARSKNSWQWEHKHKWSFGGTDRGISLLKTLACQALGFILLEFGFSNGNLFSLGYVSITEKWTSSRAYLPTVTLNKSLALSLLNKLTSCRWRCKH